jgi:ribosomal protein L33
LVGFIDKLIVSKYCSSKPVFSEVGFCSSFIYLVFSIDVSSAYIIVLPCSKCGASFIYKMKSNGPKTEP